MSFEGLPRNHFAAIYASKELELGKAAEHLVCADLMLSGHRAFLTDQGLPYDVVVEVGGRFLRIQVKATQKPKNANTQGRAANLVYVFNARRRGKGGSKRLSNDECEIVAFVALDIRAIAYFPLADVAQTVGLYPPGYKFPGKFKRSRYVAIDGFPFEKAAAKC